MASKNCVETPSFFINSKTSLRFKLGQQQIKAATNPVIWAAHRQTLAGHWRQLLTAIASPLGQQQLSKHELVDLIKASRIEYQGNTINGYDLYRQSSDAEWYRIQDHLEVGQFQQNGQRLTENVALEHNKNLHSRHIYQQFIAMAKQVSTAQSPSILVVTASARDPFEAVDFYRNAFISAGAKSVQWLPLDAALQHARRANQGADCQQLPQLHATIQGVHNRAAVYPDLVELQQQHCHKPELTLAMIEQADGIFINGGDQSLTVQAFRHSDGSDSAELTLIKQKLAAGNLVVGGTSAGTAVQSGNPTDSLAMITNGSSINAVRYGAFASLATAENCDKDGSCGELPDNALSYKQDGGLGLFHWGITDTHFAERGRHTRLAILAKQTGSRLGFGVDEATALLANTKVPEQAMQVIGQGGVHVLDIHQATLAQSDAGISFSNARWHGFFANDQFQVAADGSVQFVDKDQETVNEAKKPTQPVSVTLADDSGVFYNATLRQQGQWLAQQVVTGDIKSPSQQQTASEFTLSLTADQQTYVVCQPESQQPQCSWLNMALSVSPAPH
ncbi:cyanophycinase [Neiella marina]|uniref:cyanophycinase n=1 Tax=Neiella marina TaxID=508461 RepID=UPI00117CED0C|nr:cyanophycinase [Neiella marina]